MWIPDFMLRWIGNDIRKELQMSEQATDTTPWYKNVSTLSHIFNALVGLAGAVSSIVVQDFHGTLPSWSVKAGGVLLAIASGIGIYDNHSS